MFSVKDPSSRLLRWRLLLEEYDYTIAYKAGKKNVNADALTLQRGVTSTARHSVNITCRGVTSHARHAARSHSFVYISTS